MMIVVSRHDQLRHKENSKCPDRIIQQAVLISKRNKCLEMIFFMSFRKRDSGKRGATLSQSDVIVL